MNRSPRPRIVEAEVDEAILTAFGRGDGVAGKLAHLAGVPLVFDKVSIEQQQRHSGASGTADLVVTYRRNARAVLQLLVENKVNAGFTPEQPARYRTSQQARQASGEAERVLTILLCPEIYAAATRHAPAFDAIVTYESLLDDFEVGEERVVLEMAILKAATPYHAEDVPAVSGFFAALAAIAAEAAPMLALKSNPNVDGARPEASRTIYFDVRRTLTRHPGLPAVRFSLQCWDSGAPSASAKIMIRDWARHLAIVRPLAAEALAGTGFYIRPAGASLGIVADTPRLDTMRPAAEQIDEIRTALAATARLAAWWNLSDCTVAAWLPQFEGPDSI